MHPDIAAYVSKRSYENRTTNREDCYNLIVPPPLAAMLRAFLMMSHTMKVKLIHLDVTDSYIKIEDVGKSKFSIPHVNVAIDLIMRVVRAKADLVSWAIFCAVPDATQHLR